MKYSLGRVPAPSRPVYTYDGVFRQEKVGILHKLFTCQLCENGSRCAAKFSIVAVSLATVSPHKLIYFIDKPSHSMHCTAATLGAGAE